jgi:hypothetical protein
MGLMSPARMQMLRGVEVGGRARGGEGGGGCEGVLC